MTQEPEWFRQRLREQEEAGPTTPLSVEQKMADEMQLRATASTSAIHRAISAQQDTDHAAEAVTIWIESFSNKTPLNRNICKVRMIG